MPQIKQWLHVTDDLWGGNTPFNTFMVFCQTAREEKINYEKYNAEPGKKREIKQTTKT